MRLGRVVLAGILVLAAFAASARGAHATTTVTWCGNGALQSAVDRTPDAVAGPQVHVLYAHASDQPDRLAMFADAMASDAATADAWWRTQDPTRTLRYDLFGFANCSGLAALDISDVALPHDTNYFQPLSGVAGGDRYEKIINDLTGFQSDWKKYVVYYDGAVASTNTCGQGGGNFGTGPDYAILYLQACGLATASVGYRAHVATHELIHALGAVDSSAPHDCGGANTGHVCDSLSDVMYWQSQTTTTMDTDILDVGHDDYYGNGAADDIRKSQWLSQLDVGQVAATVTINGNGTVASDVPGLSCPSQCTNTWDRGSSFTLSATPADGVSFLGWSGACSGTDDCKLTMDAAKSVTATFGKANVTLAVSVGGKGTVSSAPAGISCPGRCSSAFPADTAVALKAKPARGYVFSGWSGACRGKGACSVSLSANASVRATFRKR